MLHLARQHKEIVVVVDQIGSPSSARELAKSTAEVLGKFTGATEQNGVFHLSASGYASRFAFANKIVETAGRLSDRQSVWAAIRAISTENYPLPLPATRPLNATTSKEKIKRIFGVEIPTWEMQLDSFMPELINKQPAKTQDNFRG